MTFDWPWALLTIPVIAVIAVWVLLRPRRTERTVGSHRLWQAALAAAGSRGRRRSISSTTAWLCVLAGCVLAAGALARPVWRGERPTRHVSIILAATAELGPQGPDVLSQAVSEFLDRLDSADRARLVLPNALGATDEWRSVGQVRADLNDLKTLPARWDQLSFAPATAGSQMVVALAPAGQVVVTGSADAVIELPCDLPPVTIDRFGARKLGNGRAGALVTVRNNTTSGRGYLLGLGASDQPAKEVFSRGALTVFAGDTSTMTLDVNAGTFLTVVVVDSESRALGTVAYLAYRSGSRRTVAMVGRDDPMIRRFIDADPMLTLTSDVDAADVVVAVGVEPPTGKPALLIQPSPAGGVELEIDALLSAESIAADDEVMRGVDLSGVAIRRMGSLASDAGGEWVPLAVVDGQTAIARSSVDLILPDRVVAIGFELSTENTNWTTTESFVIFMANAIRWLAPGEEGAGEYVATAPIAEGFAEPGFYQDSAGAWRVVSLTGLRGGEPAAPVAEQIAALKLPSPRSAQVDRPLWLMLTAAALGCLLLGWLLYAREG